MTNQAPDVVVARATLEGLLELARAHLDTLSDVMGKAGHAASEQLADEFELVRKCEKLLNPHDEASFFGDDQAIYGEPMEMAPKDQPIFAWCEHEADAHFKTNTLFDEPMDTTSYMLHAEGGKHAGTGMRVLEWGGAREDNSGRKLPDWWFVVGTHFEVAANPIHWMPVPSEMDPMLMQGLVSQIQVPDGKLAD